MAERPATACTTLPPLLAEVMQSGTCPPDQSVDCVYEPSLDIFLVERIGTKSMIGMFFGTSISSFPCHAKGTYGRAISAGYEAAIREGQQRYEQVLASIKFPDNTRRWVPYHRLVIPARGQANRNSVRVVSEIAPVDLRVI